METTGQSAAEKRAARRARVLAGGDRRLQLVTGQVSKLKSSKEEEKEEQVLDEGVNELVSENAPEGTSEIVFPTRIDPSQRRRDAAARRQRKEAMVQELLGNNTQEESVSEKVEETIKTDTNSSVNAPLPELPAKTSPVVGWSRHTLALRLISFQDKFILLILVGMAMYLAFTMDLHHLQTDLIVSDPLFLNYQQLVSQGVTIDVIRKQMEREQVSKGLMQQVEQLFTSERVKATTSSTWSSGTTSWIPNLLDWPQYWITFFSHPPIVFYVIVLRLVLSLVGHTIHSVLKLPDVKSPQEEDLGMVLNLVLTRRPTLKGYIIQSRKAMDELFVFLWVFILVVAIRVVIEYHIV